MKKFLILILTLIILLLIVISIVMLNTKKEEQNKDKIQIIATLFPQYDFAKQIGKDKVEVSILLPAGVESHTYEPTPQDIININNADIFVYTGKNMEPWAYTIANSIDSDTYILDASKNIDLIKIEEHHEENEHEYDPHIWLNPEYAIKMVENIRDTLCNIDPENSEYYTNNSKEYIIELKKLDNDIVKIVENGKRKEIVFGGIFAYAYFIEKYQLDFASAYDSCGEGVEPSVSDVKKVIDYINENNIPVIFYQELSIGNIAKTISEETGVIPLVFNTIHNVSIDNIENGATYISLMRQNLENLEKALN